MTTEMLFDEVAIHLSKLVTAAANPELFSSGYLSDSDGPLRVELASMTPFHLDSLMREYYYEGHLDRDASFKDVRFYKTRLDLLQLAMSAVPAPLGPMQSTAAPTAGGGPSNASSTHFAAESWVMTELIPHIASQQIFLGSRVLKNLEFCLSFDLALKVLAHSNLVAANTARLALNRAALVAACAPVAATPQGIIGDLSFEKKLDILGDINLLAHPVLSNFATPRAAEHLTEVGKSGESVIPINYKREIQFLLSVTAPQFSSEGGSQLLVDLERVHDRWFPRFRSHFHRQLAEYNPVCFVDICDTMPLEKFKNAVAQFPERASCGFFGGPSHDTSAKLFFNRLKKQRGKALTPNNALTLRDAKALLVIASPQYVRDHLLHAGATLGRPPEATLSVEDSIPLPDSYRDDMKFLHMFFADRAVGGHSPRSSVSNRGMSIGVTSDPTNSSNTSSRANSSEVAILQQHQRSLSTLSCMSNTSSRSSSGAGSQQRNPCVMCEDLHRCLYGSQHLHVLYEVLFFSPDKTQAATTPHNVDDYVLLGAATKKALLEGYVECCLATHRKDSIMSLLSTQQDVIEANGKVVKKQDREIFRLNHRMEASSKLAAELEANRTVQQGASTALRAEMKKRAAVESECDELRKEMKMLHLRISTLHSDLDTEHNTLALLVDDLNRVPRQAANSAIEPQRFDNAASYVGSDEMQHRLLEIESGTQDLQGLKRQAVTEGSLIMLSEVATAEDHEYKTLQTVQGALNAVVSIQDEEAVEFVALLCSETLSLKEDVVRCQTVDLQQIVEMQWAEQHKCLPVFKDLRLHLESLSDSANAKIQNYHQSLKIAALEERMYQERMLHEQARRLNEEQMALLEKRIVRLTDTVVEVVAQHDPNRTTLEIPEVVIDDTPPPPASSTSATSTRLSGSEEGASSWPRTVSTETTKSAMTEEEAP